MVLVAVVGSVAIMLLVLTAFLLKPGQERSDDAVPSNNESTNAATEQANRHPLTGAMLNEPLLNKPNVLAVMVENSADAWPLSGLEEAFLVIEAPAEGNIPRFIAFFAEDGGASEKIGPVRSARPYYLDWASEFGGLYAHVGGSPEALDLLKTAPVTNLDEYFQGEYFWRDQGRYAPHNAYTSTDELIASLDEFPQDPTTYSAWQFKDSQTSDCLSDKSCVSATIDWTGGSTYDVALDYDVSKHQYLRSQVGNTVSGTKFTADNVVVIATDISVIDNIGRRAVRTLGEGDALLFQDGTMMLVKWKKLTATDRLSFYGADGKEILMNAGKTLVEVIPSLGAVSTHSAE